MTTTPNGVPIALRAECLRERGGNRPPVHCPECTKHHGVRRAPTPVWVRFKERA